jgi:predicted nuclease with TOPRIM domain
MPEELSDQTRELPEEMPALPGHSRELPETLRKLCEQTRELPERMPELPGMLRKLSDQMAELTEHSAEFSEEEIKCVFGPILTS